MTSNSPDSIVERTYTKPSDEKTHRARYPDHWERYEFALRYVKDREALDVACGCGYGTAFLARNGAKRASGYDVDETAISWAREHYGRYATFTKVGLDSPWPAEDCSFHSVVSMETLEHVSQPVRFLEEAWRVLRPNGQLIISTPINESEQRRKPINQYHLREYSWSEFAEMINVNFVMRERWSQVSRLGAAWANVKKSRWGELVGQTKQRIPPRVVSFIRRSVLLAPSSTAGVIVQGLAAGAAVQIIVAEKVSSG